MRLIHPETARAELAAPALGTAGVGTDADLAVSRIQRRATATGRLAAWLSLIFGWLTVLVRSRSLAGKFGRYRLGEKIGEGGMGVIYKATDQSQRPVAIKLLPAERKGEADRRRFEREAHLTRLLRHPNTISVFDFGRTRDGAPYYVMEYLDGVDLQTLVDGEGPLAPERVARVLAELAGALGEVHRLGLLHGDVKPANVVACRDEKGDERVKLLDFGLAREVGAHDSLLDESRAVLGTPLYLSPEALTNPGRIDGRSDLYALGAVGYFLLTGTPPFPGKTVLDVFLQHVHALPVTPSQRLRRAVPRELESLVMRCLAKTPEERPASADALRGALLSLPLLAGDSERTRAACGVSRSLSVARRRRAEGRELVQA